VNAEWDSLSPTPHTQRCWGCQGAGQPLQVRRSQDGSYMLNCPTHGLQVVNADDLSSGRHPTLAEPDLMAGTWNELISTGLVDDCWRCRHKTLLPARRTRQTNRAGRYDYFVLCVEHGVTTAYSRELRPTGNRPSRKRGRP
jgi:hypothetical protein